VAAALATEDDLDPRSGLRVPIRLHVEVEAGGARREASIRNLSIGGAYVALDEPPEVEAELVLSLRLGDRPLRIEAQVRHRLVASLPGRAEREPGAGVAFRPIDPADQRHLADFIQERIGSFRL
jgi:hypothetical protein